MPVPLLAAIPVALGMTWSEIGLGVAAASLLTYVGIERQSSFPSFGSAPSGKNTVPVTFPTKKKTVSPSAAKASSALSNSLKPAVSAASKSASRQLEASKASSAALDDFARRVNEKNASLSESAGNSKFLQQQVESKSSLDQISFAVNAQSVVLAMIYESLERNLSMMAAASVASAKLSDLTSGQIDSADDLPYVDSGSFYDLLSSKNPDIDPYRLSQARVLEDELTTGGVLRGKSYAEIKDDVDAFRSRYFYASELAPVRSAVSGVSTATVSSSVPSVTVSVPAQAAPVVNVSPAVPLIEVSSVAPVVNVASVVPDVTVNVPVQEAPVVNVEIPDYSDKLERMASAADSAKVVSDYVRTPSKIRDILGEEVVTAAPMEVSIMKDAALAKGEADTNSLKSDVLDFMDSIFDDMDISAGMLKSYIRFDTLLNQAAQAVDNGSDNWESLMTEFYR